LSSPLFGPSRNISSDLKPLPPVIEPNLEDKTLLAVAVRPSNRILDESLLGPDIGLSVLAMHFGAAAFQVSVPLPQFRIVTEQSPE
jgi:hypothetical protein